MSLRTDFPFNCPCQFLAPLVLHHLFLVIIYYWQGFPHIQVMLCKASLLHSGTLSPLTNHHSPCSQAALLVLHGFVLYRTEHKEKSFPKLHVRDKTAEQ